MKARMGLSLVEVCFTEGPGGFHTLLGCCISCSAEGAAQVVPSSLFGWQRGGEVKPMEAQAHSWA